MIQFLPIALQLANRIPAVQKLLGTAKTEIEQSSIAKTVVEFATTHLGVTPETLPSISREAEAKLALAVTEHKAQLLKAAQDNLADARAMYTAATGSKGQADKMADGIMRWNIPYMLVLVAIQCVCMYYFQENGTMLALIGNVVGLIIGALIQERNAIVGFYYASMDGVERLLNNKDDSK